MNRTEALRGMASIALLATVLTACGAGAQAAETGGGHAPAATEPVATATPPGAPAQTGTLDLDSATGLCAILPSDRAAAALGEAVGRGSATHSASFANASCHYDSTTSDASITIWYHAGLTRAEWEASMVKIGMTAEDSVEGIGDAAYRQDRSGAHPRVKLAAFQGDHDIWVIIAKSADIGVLAATAEREARELLAAVR